MKKIMGALLGLSLVLGLATVSFAKDDKMTTSTTKTKKSKKTHTTATTK